MALPRRALLAGLGRRALALAAVSLTGSPGDARDEGPPALHRGTRESRARWVRLHDQYVDIALQGRISGLLLGDSLTYGWLVTARTIYDNDYLPRGIHAFGIGGDRTRDLLWRIEHGELSGPAPKVVAVMIGTNDLGFGERDVAAGIMACVAAIRTAAPNATVLLLGILPRGRGGARGPRRREIAAVNAEIARLDDGHAVRFLDIGPSFTRSDGTVDARLFEPDLVHLSLEGYVVWERAMAPALDALLAAPAPS